MLKIHIKDTDLFNEENGTIIKIKDQFLTLEHSLISVSKWESKWKKPFISKNEKTLEETIDYIKCMTLTPNVDDNLYNAITSEHIQIINEYIMDPMTATTISNVDKKSSREIITSEVIYYMMFANRIPKECEKWHLNRLMMLIEVFGAKNQPAKKMSKNALAKRNRSLNAKRRAATGSRG